METEIVVKYKDGENYATERFESWMKDGGFVFFFNDKRKSLIKLMIPVENVISIRTITEEDLAEENRDFIKKHIENIVVSGSVIVESDLVEAVEVSLRIMQREYDAKELVPGLIRISLIEG